MLGENLHRGQSTIARIPDEMRERHAYIAGQMETGKSTLLLNMIMQDIEAGHGVGVIDPHGDLVTDVLARIPKERAGDTIYFNPTDAAYPAAFNILTWRDDDERQRLVSETIATLQRFSTTPWGSRFEHIFRCTLATVLEFKNATLADVPRLLTDATFRGDVVARVNHPDLVTFWRHEFPKLPKGATDPILNRLSAMLLNRRIRNIICQRKGRINFDSIINGKKIFLANLCTGTLTEEATGIFGTFIVSKLISAAFRRAAVPYAQRQRFHLYVDEFQAFMQTSMGFDRILAEARKYRLVLTMANQYVSQLSSEVRAAIIGNVGTLVCFRLGTTDARLLSKEFGGFTSDEVLALERGEALARIGGTQQSFNLATFPPADRAVNDLTAAIIANSRRKIARPRQEVEASFVRCSPSQVDSPSTKSTAGKPEKATTKTPQAEKAKLSRKTSKTKTVASPPAAKTPTEISDDEWDTWSDFVS